MALNMGDEYGKVCHAVRVTWPDGSVSHHGVWPDNEWGVPHPDARAHRARVEEFLAERGQGERFEVDLVFIDWSLPVFDCIDNWLDEEKWFAELNEREGNK